MKKRAFGFALAFAMAGAEGQACTDYQIGMRQRADIAIDGVTGNVLYNRNETKPFYQASLTKRMVQLLAYEAIDSGRLRKEQIIDLPVTRFRNADGETQFSDAIPFTITRISVADAITAMMIRSSNRAPLALGVAIAGTEENFVEQMNRKARDLGMMGTHYINPAGYPTRKAQLYHRTTALDHARLVRVIFLNFEKESRELRIAKAHLTGYSSNGQIERFDVKTTIALMPGQSSGYSLPNILGGKTGYACASGPGLDVEAEMDGRNVIVVTGGHRSSAERNSLAYRMIKNPDAGFVQKLKESRGIAEEMMLHDAAEKFFAPPEKAFILQESFLTVSNISYMKDLMNAPPPFPDGLPERKPERPDFRIVAMPERFRILPDRVLPPTLH